MVVWEYELEMLAKLRVVGWSCMGGFRALPFSVAALLRAGEG